MGTGEARLKRLAVKDSHPASLSHIPLLHHLQTLQLRVYHTLPNMGDAEIFGLYSILTSTPLPLRHVRMSHSITGALLDILPAFISAYSGQLHTLDLTHFYDRNDRHTLINRNGRDLVVGD